MQFLLKKKKKKKGKQERNESLWGEETQCHFWTMLDLCNLALEASFLEREILIT